MQPLVIESGANGHSTFSLPVSDYVENKNLAGGAAESITVPAGAKFAVFSATADFYVNYSATAAEIADTSDGSGDEINPAIRNISGVTTISIYSTDANKVSVAFYS